MMNGIRSTLSKHCRQGSANGRSCNPRRHALVTLLVTLGASCPACADAATSTSADPAPDEISFFGESVSSLNQWPRSSAWGISYRKIVAPYFAMSLAYLNDGHFPGHHRDGVAAEGWVPINAFSQHLTLSAGFGPFYYYDTVVAQNSNEYADNHGWAWIYSLDAKWQFRGDRTGPFVEMRLDHTAPAKSIETTSIGLGFGYRGFSDIHGTDPNAAAGFADNELTAYYWKTVVNSPSSQTAPAEEIEYRRKIWEELRASVGFLNEGDAQLIRRNGVLAEGWAEPSFDSGLWSIGVGFGGYSAIDKYRAEPGRLVSGVMSATVSVRPLKNLDIRFLWHRIVTDYSRDTDVVLWGLGYRF